MEQNNDRICMADLYDVTVACNKVEENVNKKINNITDQVEQLNAQIDKIKNNHNSEIKRLENEIIYLNERLRHNIICVAGIFLFLVPLFTTWCR
jgi:hypothetical protein